MEPIYLDELTAAAGYATFDNLTAEFNESSDMKEIIDGFIGYSGGKLQGESWNEVQSKLTEFSGALDQRMALATNLSAAIKSALDLLIAYIGDYPYLNYSELPNIKRSNEQCQMDIDRINEALAAKTYVESDILDDDGNPKLVEVYVITGQARTDLNNRITEIKASMAEIQLLIDKLEGLEAVYNEAKGILDAAFAEVEEFGITVSGITPSAPVHYVPA